VASLPSARAHAPSPLTASPVSPLGDTRRELTHLETIEDSGDGWAAVWQLPRRDPRAERRAHAEKLRAYARTLAPADTNAAKCGRVLRASAVHLRRGADGRASWDGVVTCGSPWACPCCAGRIQSERAEEVRQLVARGRADALGTVMLTLTIRHALGHELSVTRAGLGRAWKRFQQSRVWKRVRQSYGVAGFVRALEIKHGRTAGWHPHIHVLLLVSEWEAAERDLQAELSGLWRAAVVRELGVEHEPDDEHGCHVAPAYDAEYIAKMGLEIAHSISKVRGPSRSPFELLEDARRGDAQSRALWLDYTKATKGKRPLEWSRGLRKRFGLNETTDEELAARAVAESDTVTVLELSRSQWEAVHKVNGATTLLELAETGATTGQLRDAVDHLIRTHKQRLFLARLLSEPVIRHSG